MNLKEIALLQDKVFFTVQDVARVFGVTLGSARVQCSRYAKQGIFLRLKNNFYVLERNWKDGNFDYFLEVSNYLQVPSYVSVMTALFYHGLTTQVPRAFYESVSPRRSLRCQVRGVSFNYYKLKKNHYFGFKKINNLFIALPEKAFVDAVYLDSFGKYKLDYDSIDLAKLNKPVLREFARIFPDKTRSLVKKNMRDLIEQEKFELEVLNKLNSARLLDHLVFGGGTMLRLCHGLGRYSVDLDFWIVNNSATANLFGKIGRCLAHSYSMTDQMVKHYTLLYEIKSKDYPRSLKLEIRKEAKKVVTEPAIAYSPFSNTQVILRTVSLPDMMRLKIEAFLDRKAVRDAFDVEFLLKKGIRLDATAEVLQKVLAALGQLTQKDFSVVLGSLLEVEQRRYYVAKRFVILEAAIQEKLR